MGLGSRAGKSDKIVTVSLRIERLMAFVFKVWSALGWRYVSTEYEHDVYVYVQVYVRSVDSLSIGFWEPEKGITQGAQTLNPKPETLHMPKTPKPLKPPKP